MSKGLYFVAGAVVGGLVTWLSTKGYYKQRSQEDIEATREIYENFKKDDLKKKEEKQPEEPPKQHVDTKKPDNIKEYVEKLNRTNYGGVSKKEKLAKNSSYYIIPPEKLGEFDPDYESVNLTLYADGILADEKDFIFEDPEDKLGDYYNHFGEYEEFTVAIRNDDLCTDFEITRDNRTYEEVVGEKPKIRWHKNE